MIPVFLLPENTAREGGQGPEFPLDAAVRAPLLLTLGINRILEEENLEVSILGSSDGRQWQPVAAFPPKSYCGTYHLLLDLARHPDIRRLRAAWKMSRWDTSRQKPLFGFYLQVEEPVHRSGMSAAGVA